MERRKNPRKAVPARGRVASYFLICVHLRVRYNGNYRGAIYGWDQTLDNSNPRRLPMSGLECFGEIMARWPRSGGSS